MNPTHLTTIFANASRFLLAGLFFVGTSHSQILTGDHHIVPGASDTGSLTVDGDVHIGGGLDFGTTQTSNSAMAFSYAESGSNYQLIQLATRDGVSFLWRENGGGTAETKMSLDASNILTLFRSDGTTGIVLDPEQGIIDLEASGGGIILGDGTYLDEAADLYQSQIVNGTGFLAVSSSGKLGLGVTNPAYALTLDGSTSHQTIGMTRASSYGNNLTLAASDGGDFANRWGGNLVLAGGRGTGQYGSSIVFQTGSKGTSGSSTLNPLVTRMTLNEHGALGLGAGAFTGDYYENVGGIDISWGGIPATLMLGADTNLSTRTNNTIKQMSVRMPHYDTSKKPVEMLSGYIGSGTNQLRIGGGSGGLATTLVNFYTAPDSVTEVGISRLQIDQFGRVTINQTKTDSDFRVASMANDNMIYVDASANSVGIGTAAPTANLHVAGDAKVDGTLRVQPRGDLSMGPFTN
jgi:hypothetical protein